MDNFFTFAVIFFVSYIVIQLVIGYFVSRQEAREELANRMYKKLDEIIHRVKVEEHHGHLYWFDQDNDRFLAQGATQDEVIAAVRKRFPEHIFFLSKNEVVAESTGWQLSNQNKVEFSNLKLD